MEVLTSTQTYVWLVEMASLDAERHQNCLELNLYSMKPNCLLLPLSVSVENFLLVMVQTGLTGFSVVLVVLQKKKKMLHCSTGILMTQRRSDSA